MNTAMEVDSGRIFPHDEAAFDGSVGRNHDENSDDMIDDEVAVASSRASRRRIGSALTTKYRLRPKPLRKEDSWDCCDVFFRD